MSFYNLEFSFCCSLKGCQWSRYSTGAGQYLMYSYNHVWRVELQRPIEAFEGNQNKSFQLTYLSRLWGRKKLIVLFFFGVSQWDVSVHPPMGSFKTAKEFIQYFFCLIWITRKKKFHKPICNSLKMIKIVSGKIFEFFSFLPPPRCNVIHTVLELPWNKNSNLTFIVASPSPHSFYITQSVLFHIFVFFLLRMQKKLFSHP